MEKANNQTLPIGYQLQHYTITKVLSTGGFSFVYLAQDSDNNTVAIKEYMPTGLALREQGATVMLSSNADATAFKHGLKCFLKRAWHLQRLIMKISCASLTSLEKTTRFIWSCNTSVADRCKLQFLLKPSQSASSLYGESLANF